MQWYYGFSAILLIFVKQCPGRDLPSYFPRCHVHDNNLNECVLKAARMLKPHVRKGVKEIKLPVFGPLVISSMTIKQGQNKFTYANVTVTGLDDYEFDGIEYDPNNLKLTGKVKFRDVFYIAHYNVSAWAVYFPIVGDGIAEATFGLINGTFEMRGELATHKLGKYYKPTSVKVRITVNDASARANGLFDGNPELGGMVNDLVNLNVRTLTDMAIPGLEEVIEKFLITFIRALTKLVSYNKTFPHS